MLANIMPSLLTCFLKCVIVLISGQIFTYTHYWEMMKSVGVEEHLATAIYGKR
jgi:hypothetical protein